MMTGKMGDRDSPEEIRRVFKLFDDDETGRISFRNLKRVARELGENMTDEELQEMINKVRHDLVRKDVIWMLASMAVGCSVGCLRLCVIHPARPTQLRMPPLPHASLGCGAGGPRRRWRGQRRRVYADHDVQALFQGCMIHRG